MREAAQEACAFVADISKTDFIQSPLLQHGVQHCIYIIGEAASRISDTTRQTLPEIEWSVIRGMRNRLAHAYFDIDLEIIWKTVMDNLPQLQVVIDRILQGQY